MNFAEIVNRYSVDYTKNLIEKIQVDEVENVLGILLPNSLKEYILNYGYLGYRHIELYGVYSNEYLKTDMIKQTLYLHKYFEKTRNYIALENIGEGGYILLDTNDEVYEYDSEMDILIKLDKHLLEYIYDRFAEAE